MYEYTNKTNGYRVVNLANYIRWCCQHLAKDAIQIDRPRLTEIHQRSEKYLEECSGFLSENEYLYIKNTIAKKIYSNSKTPHQGPQRQARQQHVFHSFSGPRHALHGGIP